MSGSYRLLVGLSGQEPDACLIRYASMVCRLSVADGLEPATSSWPRASIVAESVQRSRLRARVDAHFAGSVGRTVVGCNILERRAFRRLPTLIADSQSDLLLLGDADMPRSRCAWLATAAPCSVWFVPRGSAPLLRRILVPFNFSDRSVESLHAAIGLARQFSCGKCLALHVDRGESRFAAVDELRRRELARRFDHFAANLDTRGVGVEPVFASGHHLGRAIGRAASQQRADLVVMASRRRSPSAAVLAPGAAASAIGECRQPVLWLKPTGPTVGMLELVCQRLRSASPQFC
jgi:nucleotide-binding universal stress UspA family protein